MRDGIIGAGAIALAFGFGAPALAAEDRLETARILAHKAADHIDDVGLTRAAPDISDPDGRFVDGEIYVFVATEDGDVLAHGANAGMIGQSVPHLRDAEGKPYVEEMIAVSRSGDPDWVDYHWPHPQTHQVALKRTYILPREGYFIGVGVYPE